MTAFLPRQHLLRHSFRQFSSKPPPPPPPKSRRLKPTTLLALALTAGGAGSAYYYYFSNTSNRCLNQQSFTPYKLTSIQHLSEDPRTAIFTLTHPAHPPPMKEWIESVQIKHPGMMIARAYTPLPNISSENGGSEAAGGDRREKEKERQLRLLIKLTPGGEMSRYLFSLTPGADVGCRGTYPEYLIPQPPSSSTTSTNSSPFSTSTLPNPTAPAPPSQLATTASTPEARTDFLFLAGGTGLTPALQLASKLPPNSTLQILWAVRSRSEISGLNTELSHHLPPNVRIETFVDTEGTYITPSKIKAALGEKGRKKVVLVSGPDGFISYFAGSKQYVNGQETQGSVGGVIRGVLKGSGGEEVEVWKL